MIEKIKRWKKLGQKDRNDLTKPELAEWRALDRDLRKIDAMMILILRIDTLERILRRTYSDMQWRMRDIATEMPVLGAAKQKPK